MKNLIKFLTSKKLAIHIVLAIILAFVIFYIAIWATGIYAHHGEKISVPDLDGLKVSEAEKILKEEKLRYSVIDSMFDKNAVPGSVLEQFPRSGAEVKRNREIKLTIATVVPQLVVVDRVRDLSLRQAIAQLSKKGIGVKNIEYRLSDYTHLVLGIKHGEKELVEGDEIYKGEELTLVVGYNEGDTFSVPNLYGLSEKYARIKALESGINIGKVVCKNCEGKKINKATVSWQSVKAEELIGVGSQVNLLLVMPK